MSMRDIHKAVREEIDKKIVEEAERGCLCRDPG